MDDEFETLSLCPEDHERAAPTARRLALLVAGLAVLTGGAVAGWQRDPHVEPAGHPEQRPVQLPVEQPPAAYLPGGSVYDQQVPRHVDWKTAYGPGSSLYRSQVPPAAR
jgi:hypothetical protein